jgi:hypothetical protein
VKTRHQGTIRNLEGVTRDFARRLRQEFPEDIARNPRDFKKEVIRLIRCELPPRRGRPNDPRLDAAYRMAQQGKSTSEILRSQVPGFETMDAYSRYLAGKGLHAAIARRRRLTAKSIKQQSDSSGRAQS